MDRSVSAVSAEMPASPGVPAAASRGIGLPTFAAWGLCTAVAALFGGWPLPDVNESYYLLKARHYWDPTFLPNDLFLQSRDAHHVFFLALGGLFALGDTAEVAWVGRVLGWMALAAGWTALVRALDRAPGPPNRGTFLRAALLPPLSFALFAWLQNATHMAGEWVIGGIEGKVFSWACVWLGLAAIARDRWNTAGLWLGGACLFHVLVGGWAAVAAAWTWLLLGPRDPRRWGLGALCGGALALVAVVPNLSLEKDCPPEDVIFARQAVAYRRLHHHLDFRQFQPWFCRRHALAAAGAVVLGLLVVRRARQGVPGSERLLRLVAFESGSLLILGGGLIATYALPYESPQQAGWLRFYWFRLDDVVLPLLLTLATAEVCGLFAVPAGRFAAGLRRTTALVGTIAACAALGQQALDLHRTAAPRSFKEPGAAERHHLFREACLWIRANTPPGSQFLIPRSGYVFKWYAERPDVANWKDMPQDAATQAVWWRRMDSLYKYDSKTRKYLRHLDDIPPAELRTLARGMGAEFLLIDAEVPLPYKRVYLQAGTPGMGYAVYDLRPTAEPPATPERTPP